MAFDPQSTNNLRQLTSEVRTFLNKPADLNNKAARRNFYNALKALEDETDTVLKALADDLEEPRDEVGFADFLSDIGDSVVETQRKLDDQSIAYLKETESKKQITPAIYRIPKVSANIKFGMRSFKKKGFNIVVAQSSEESEKTLNQSLDFEIISVPPPPDYKQSLSEDFPSIGFVFSKLHRNAIFEAIDTYQPSGPQTKWIKKDLLLDQQNNIIIMEVGPTIVKGMDDYILLAADDKAEKNLGIWYLRIDPEKKMETVLEVVLGFSADFRQGENFQILQKLIIEQAKVQSSLLS